MARMLDSNWLIRKPFQVCFSMAVFTCVMAIGWNEAPEELWVPFDIDQGFTDQRPSEPVQQLFGPVTLDLDGRGP